MTAIIISPVVIFPAMSNFSSQFCILIMPLKRSSTARFDFIEFKRGNYSEDQVIKILSNAAIEEYSFALKVGFKKS